MLICVPRTFSGLWGLPAIISVCLSTCPSVCLSVSLYPDNMSDGQSFLFNHGRGYLPLGWVGLVSSWPSKKKMKKNYESEKNQILKKIFLVCKLLVCFCFCFRICVCSAVISPFKMHVKNCCDSTIKKTYNFFQFQRLKQDDLPT